MLNIRFYRSPSSPSVSTESLSISIIPKRLPFLKILINWKLKWKVDFHFGTKGVYKSEGLVHTGGIILFYFSFLSRFSFFLPLPSVFRVPKKSFIGEITKQF